jgi:hypothetical protein
MEIIFHGEKMDKNISKEMIRNNFLDALNNFDFSKVWITMESLGWEWSGIGIPTQKNMIETVEELFEELLRGNELVINVSTGGFTVELLDDGNIRIFFTVVESESSN